MPAGVPQPPRFDSLSPLHIEAPDLLAQSGHSGSIDYDKEGAVAGATRAVLNYRSWLPSLFDMPRSEFAATVLGGILGTIVTAASTRMAMRMCLIPGMSQITIILACSLLKSGGLSKLLGWAGLNGRGRSTFLLILQSCGSAPSAAAFGIILAAPVGLMLEKNWRDAHGVFPDGYVNTAMHSGDEMTYKGSDTLDVAFVFKIVLACVGGTFTGAAWTNINMAEALKSKHPAPEAYASASLIGSFAAAGDADGHQADQPAGTAEPGVPRGGHRAKRSGHDGWFVPSFGAGCLVAIVFPIAVWLGVAGDYFEYKLPHQSKADIFEKQWNITVQNIERNLTTQGVISSPSDVFKIPGIQETADGIKKLQTALYAGALGSLIIDWNVSAAALNAGIGALIPFRSCAAMMLGSLTFIWLHYFLADLMSAPFAGGVMDLDDARSAIAAAEGWSSGGDTYKWVAVSIIAVNTMDVLWGVISHAFKVPAAGSTREAQSVPVTLRKAAWVAPFNFISIVLGYAITLGFLFLSGPSNWPLYGKAIMFFVTLGSDYVCNLIGGQQSLEVGGTNSPVSACLMLAVVILAVLSTFVQYQEGDANFNSLAVVPDYRLLVVWLVRLFVSINFTNDAAQDYATTQIMSQNIYVGTRQNLLSALLGCLVLPWVFTQVSRSGGEYGTSADSGFGLPTCTAMVTLWEGITGASIPYMACLLGFALGVGCVAMKKIGGMAAKPTDKLAWRAVVWTCRDFSPTGFAIGMYLGSGMSLGLLFGALALKVGVWLRGGAASAGKSKEVLLTVVGILAGNSLGQMVQVVLGLLRDWMPDSTIGTIETPFWGNRTDPGSEWKAFEADHLSVKVLTAFGIGISSLLVLVSQWWGNEMPEVAAEAAGEDSDAEDGQLDAEALLAAREKVDAELQDARVLHALEGTGFQDADDIDDWTRADQQAVVLQNRLRRAEARRQVSRANILGRYANRAFSQRTVKDLESPSRYTAFRNTMVALVVAMSVVWVAVWMLQARDHMTWSWNANVPLKDKDSLATRV